MGGAEFMAAIAVRRAAARPQFPVSTAGSGLRFAFYGRMSTTGFQDAATSRAWQRAVADELVEGVGHIVVEFFDEGVSRRWSWDECPAASALLAAAESAASGELARRPFDAVVVGEYERAFYADQFQDVVERLAAVGV